MVHPVLLDVCGTAQCRVTRCQASHEPVWASLMSSDWWGAQAKGTCDVATLTCVNLWAPPKPGITGSALDIARLPARIRDAIAEHVSPAAAELPFTMFMMTRGPAPVRHVLFVNSKFLPPNAGCHSCPRCSTSRRWRMCRSCCISRPISRMLAVASGPSV